MDRSAYTIQRFATKDWQLFRQIRLEALQQHSELFTPSKDETQFGSEDWQRRLSTDKAAIFGLFCRKDVVGLTAVVVDRDDARKAVMVMSYIRQAHRNKGLSSLFYECRIAWARRLGSIDLIETGHVIGNIASKKANQKFGFKKVRTIDHIDVKGCRKEVVTYHLRL